MKYTLFAVPLLCAALAAPATAQTGLFGGMHVSAEPYVGYGFFGTLPNGPKLDAALAYGGRVALELSPQWAAFANYQRSEPKLDDFGDKATVDHWSAGVEFSYVPRGGAEGMLPILIEAGVGQARYDFAPGNDVYNSPDINALRVGAGEDPNEENDLAANIGIASTLQLVPDFGIRYGANDYISNFNEQGITNQIFVHVGAEFRF